MISNTTKTKTTYHITTADAKKQLNIDSAFTTDDDYLTDLVKRATAAAENYIDKDIAATATVLEIYDFNGTGVTLHDVPFISLTTITYLDSADAEQSVTTANVEIRKYQQKTTLVLPDSLDTDLLTVTYATGHTAASTVPHNQRSAIMQMMSDLYDVERGSMVSKAFMDSRAFERSLEFDRKVSY